MNITIQFIEKEIDNVLKSKVKRLANNPDTEKNLNYKSDLVKANFSGFINSGDYCYFTARVIFLQGLGIIAFLLAHQALENYLKAYMKFKGHKSINGHDLLNLHSICLPLCDKKSFLLSKRAKHILKRFNPFYEIPRYPVQKTRPKDGRFGFLVPDDIYYLDYFIYKLRPEMPLPKGAWDMFKEGIPFGTTLFNNSNESQKIINIFKWENILFTK